MSVKEITTENFEKEVLQNEKTVLLDFWAEWCGPCRMVSPIIHEIAEEMDTITVGKINVDEQGALANAFAVNSIPMLVVIKNGKIVNQAIGYMPKEKILELL